MRGVVLPIPRYSLMFVVQDRAEGVVIAGAQWWARKQWRGVSRLPFRSHKWSLGLRWTCFARFPVPDATETRESRSRLHDDIVIKRRQILQAAKVGKPAMAAHMWWADRDRRVVFGGGVGGFACHSVGGVIETDAYRLLACYDGFLDDAPRCFRRIARGRRTAGRAGMLHGRLPWRDGSRRRGVPESQALLNRSEMCLSSRAV